MSHDCPACEKKSARPGGCDEHRDCEIVSWEASVDGDDFDAPADGAVAHLANGLSCEVRLATAQEQYEAAHYLRDCGASVDAIEKFLTDVGRNTVDAMYGILRWAQEVDA